MKICGELKKYERLEFQFESRITHIKILRPCKTYDIAEAFTYQPIAVNYNNEGIEQISADGSEIFVCRYTPDFSGTAVIEAYNENGITEKTELEIADSNSFGYIEISKNDKKYFAYSNGNPFFPVGVNTAFPTAYSVPSGSEFGIEKAFEFIGLRQYERWFKKLSENGVNVARIWLGHEYFSPDTPEVYEFDSVQFSKIDRLISLAKKYKIKLKLTLEQFRFFDYEKNASPNSFEGDIFRKFSKRLFCKGHRCENMKEWLTNSVWRSAWLAKVKEFAKRYAGDTEIFAIELWNEMNTFGEWENVIEWNKTVLPEVRKMFPKNLVINSLGSLDCEAVQKMYSDFCWENCDFVQIHRYFDQGAEFCECGENPVTMIKTAFERVKTDKPLFIAETGAVNDCHSGTFRFYVNDNDGIILADTVYTPVFLKSCGTGNIWHWDERYIEAKNLYRMFRPISDLVFGVEFDKEDFTPLDFSNSSVSLLLLKGKSVALGYIRNKNHSWENVLRDLKEVSPVGSFEFNMSGAKSIKCFPVWQADKTEAKVSNETIRFENIGIGTLFKIHLI